jgi:hypothetical protein
MKRKKHHPDSADLRREAYGWWNASMETSNPSTSGFYRELAAIKIEAADWLESQEPAAHQPAGFIKLYPSQ